jgi:hypothetical protein
MYSIGCERDMLVKGSHFCIRERDMLVEGSHLCLREREREEEEKKKKTMEARES